MLLLRIVSCYGHADLLAQSSYVCHSHRRAATVSSRGSASHPGPNISACLCATTPNIRTGRGTSRLARGTGTSAFAEPLFRKLSRSQYLLWWLFRLQQHDPPSPDLVHGQLDRTQCDYSNFILVSAPKFGIVVMDDLVLLSNAALSSVSSRPARVERCCVLPCLLWSIRLFRAQTFLHSARNKATSEH
jgi:hypothetical protein